MVQKKRATSTFDLPETTTYPSAKANETHKQTIATMTEVNDKKKRRRPANLELRGSNLVPNSKDMRGFALQGVSPGLPPLSAEMKSTVLISKAIEAQQHSLISARVASGSLPLEDDALPKDSNQYATNNENVDKESPLITPSTSGLTNNMDDLSIPSAGSNKRLKRDKAPPPLNLKLAQGATKPIIKSAPLYDLDPNPYYTPATARRQQFAKKRVATGPQTNGQRPLRSVNFTPTTSCDQSQFRRQIPNTANPYAPYHLRHFSLPPKTATGVRNPLLTRNGAPLTQQQLGRYQQQLAYQQQQWAKFKEYQDQRKANHVTDVFEGEATRLAPPSSQPLSAQKAFFNFKATKPPAASLEKKRFDDRITEESAEDDVADDENADDKNADDDEDDDDSPESQAIEEDAKVGLNLRKDPSVKAHLRLGDNAFQFSFERLENSPDNDKKRFLSFCATAWDQFNRI